LIGFVKEALDVTPKAGEETFYTEPKVNFICQRADFAIVERWTQFVDDNWQKARDKINAAINEEQSAKP
jgi:predicted DNA-binding ArsR family transcriptional regulator